MPTFEAEYSGFKNNETANVLTKQPTITTTATSASEPGEYEITVSGAEAKNYAISYFKGKLTITEADPVTITAKSYTIKYGDELPTFWNADHREGSADNYSQELHHQAR